jgi:Holliday junction resolvase RusA-like endonuclease
MSIKQVIQGNCPSKSNCYIIVGHGLIKSKKLREYEELFYIQCNQYRNANIDGYFELHIDVYYPSQRSDLDNSLKVVLDCLQRVKAIENDNKCVKIIACKFLDKINPRIEFSLLRA